MKTNQQFRFIFSFGFSDRLLVPLVAVTLTLLATNGAAAPAQQAYIKATNTGGVMPPDIPGDGFGTVAVDGETMVVGAPGEASSATGVNGDQSDNSARFSGAAYVFVRSGTNWSQQAYLKASNTEENDFFGSAVAVSGDTVVVGAYGESSSATGVNGDQNDNSFPNSGAAYVFVRSGTNWTQQAYLKASNTHTADEFGTAVAISGSTVAVGAGRGSRAYVFQRNGTNWSQQAYLQPAYAYSMRFGLSVGVSGDTVVVGANEERSSATGVNGNPIDLSAYNAGAAYVFVRNGTIWTQQAYLKASNTEAYDGFGGSVAVSGNTVVVSAGGEDSSATGVNGNQNDNTGTNSGAAYVFVRSGTNWSQQAYLKASNTDANDGFGTSVTVSGDTVVVSAQSESSNATGVNGNQNDNSSPQSGAAYVFVRSGVNWTQRAYLKASNTGAIDLFGVSAAVSGDTVVIGAPLESSDATGVNGDQTNDNAYRSGAAYAFAGLGVGPHLAIERDGSGGLFIRFTGAPNATYRLQRAPTVNGPWSTSAPQTAPASGVVEFHDLFPPPGQAFYRAVQS